MKKSNSTFLQRLQAFPFGVHLLILGVIITLRKLIPPVGLLLLAIFIAPILYIPNTGDLTFSSIAITTLLTVIYYSPFFFIKRKVKLKINHGGTTSHYNKKWIGLIVAYSIINITSLVIGLMIVLNGE